MIGNAGTVESRSLTMIKPRGLLTLRGCYPCRQLLGICLRGLVNFGVVVANGPFFDAGGVSLRSTIPRSEKKVTIREERWSRTMVGLHNSQ